MKPINIWLGIILVLCVVTVSGCTDNSQHTYYVGNSTFQLQGEWDQTWDVNASVQSITRYSQGIETILLTKYKDLAQHNIDYQNFLEHYPMHKTHEINGITIYGSNVEKHAYLYFFEKNRNKYSVRIDGVTEQEANETINKIVTTIN